MADYKGIKGFKVQYLSADPSDPIIGQTWYNSTSKDLKYTGATAAGAWATGNNLNTSRQSLSGAGTQTAALAFGGGYPPTAATEEYDGTNWATGNNMNTSRSELGGCGTQTAALAFGSPSATEEYDGASWTSSNPLNTARVQLAGSRNTNSSIRFWRLHYS
jgi:hypothetical protein